MEKHTDETREGEQSSTNLWQLSDKVKLLEATCL